jgi:hypothetical protein
VRCSVQFTLFLWVLQWKFCLGCKIVQRRL